MLLLDELLVEREREREDRAKVRPMMVVVEGVDRPYVGVMVAA